jgi:YD repeat-containing protein
MGNGRRSDRELNGLRGPVKTCSERSIYAPETFPKDLAPKVTEHNKTSDGFMVSALSVCTVEYDRDGKTLTIHRANPDGSALSTTYTYDADGRLLKIADDRSGRPTKTIYSCDETNSGVNTAGFQHQEQYDEQGCKTTILSVPPTPPGTAVCYVSSSPLSCLPEYAAIQARGRVPNSGGSITTIHNQRGQATEAQVHDLERR